MEKGSNRLAKLVIVDLSSTAVHYLHNEEMTSFLIGARSM